MGELFHEQVTKRLSRWMWYQENCFQNFRKKRQNNKLQFLLYYTNKNGYKHFINIMKRLRSGHSWNYLENKNLHYRTLRIASSLCLIPSDKRKRVNPRDFKTVTGKTLGILMGTWPPKI